MCVCVWCELVGFEEPGNSMFPDSISSKSPGCGLYATECVSIQTSIPKGDDDTKRNSEYPNN